MIPNEVNGKNTTEPEQKDEFEENYMTVYVKAISGKTIRIKCDKKQKAASWNNLPRPPRKNAEEREDNRGNQHRGRIYDRNVPETVGRNGRNEMKDSSETEEEK